MKTVEHGYGVLLMTRDGSSALALGGCDGRYFSFRKSKAAKFAEEIQTAIGLRCKVVKLEVGYRIKL